MTQEIEVLQSTKTQVLEVSKGDQKGFNAAEQIPVGEVKDLHAVLSLGICGSARLTSDR